MIGDMRAIDPKPLVAELIGTAFLVAGVIGSGIMAERLSDDVGLQLFENAFATWGVLLALILSLGPVSGAHFNPAVTLAERIVGTIDSARAAQYVVAQVLGGIAGAIGANVMFDLDPVTISEKDRSGAAVLFAEAVATFGLLMVIFGVVAAQKPHWAAFTVSSYIGGAYWFTSSTSFANPAVTIGRTLSDTFAGIEPSDAVWFVVIQLAAAAVGTPVLRWLFSR